MTADQARQSDEQVTRPVDLHIKMFDLHTEVLRANRALDRCFPPYNGEQHQAVYDRAVELRDHVTALIDHMDEYLRIRPGGDSHA